MNKNLPDNYAFQTQKHGINTELIFNKVFQFDLLSYEVIKSVHKNYFMT